MADESQSAPQGAGFRFRDTTRAPFTTTVRLRFDRLGGTVSAQSADISMEGMFVKTEEPRPVGTLVQFEFDVESPDGGSADQEVVQGLGDVVWVRASGGPTKPPGMGIQFRYVDGQSREHVYRIVSDFIRQISGDGGAGVSVPSGTGSVSQDHPRAPAGSEEPAALPGMGPKTQAEQIPLGSATVAAPLSSLPGWSETRDELVDTGADASASAPILTGGPPPPPPVAMALEDPFGGLLNTESADPDPPVPQAGTPGGHAGETAHADGSVGPFDSLTAPAPPAAPGQNSGSFSLSVPKLDGGASDASTPLGSLEAVEADPNLSELRQDTFSGPSASPFNLADDPSAADPAPEDAAGLRVEGVESTFAEELALSESGTTGLEPDDLAVPELDGPSLMPVEPYTPEEGQLDAGGGYYGGTAKTKRSSSMRLLALLLVAALAIAAFIFRPWQHLETLLGGSDAELASGEPDVALGFEEPAQADADEELPTIANELATGTEPTTTEPVDDTSIDSGEPEAPEAVQAAAGGTRPVPEPISDRPAASRLTDFAAADFADRTQVRIVGNGAIRADNFETVKLDNPPRFLIKVRGIEQPFQVTESTSRFESVRTGLHQVAGQSELHIVFDMVSGGFEADVRLDQGELLLSLR